jgi:hypothetical protein
MDSNSLKISDLRIISQYAKGLPVIANMRQHKITMTGKDLLAMGVQQVNKQPVLSDLKYMYEPPFITTLFHYKFLIRAWHRNGQGGLTDYLKEVAEQISIEKKDHSDPVNWTDEDILHFLKKIRKISLLKEWLRHEWVLLKVKMGLVKRYNEEDIRRFTDYKNRVWQLLIKSIKQQPKNGN